MGALQADVAILKRMVNAEKKHQTNQATDFVNVAVHNGTNISGHAIIYPSATQPSIFPVVAQGDGENNRNGTSIKLCSAYIRLHFRPQTSYTGGGRVKIMLIEKPKDSIVVGTSPISNILELDTFFNAYTPLSRRHINDFAQFRVIATRNIYFPTENYTGALDEFHKDVEFKLKFNNKHVRYDPTTNTIAHGNFALIMVSNFGNTANNTGVRCLWTSTIYYYDN